jgi:alpha-tubulin suppressor-like RCC1 family protein
MAIRSDGGLFTWGFNTSGQLGDGTTTSRSSPVQIGSSSWTAISAGYGQTAAIRSGNILFMWGAGTNGQRGDGTFANASSPVQIGNNSLTAPNRQSPVQIGTSVDTGSWIAVSVGSGASHAVAISSSRRLYTWGTNNNGQLGQNNIINSLTPVQVGTRSFTLIGTGQLHTIVR